MVTMEKTIAVCFVAFITLMASAFVSGCVQTDNATLNTTNCVGCDRDSHGCIGSAGYSWCESKQKCLRIWEENCSDNSTGPGSMPARNDSLIQNQTCIAETGESMNLTSALQIASASSCTQNATLTDRYSCNSITGTWWVDIEPREPKQGCNPACVINVKTGEAEINWRCTGFIMPQ